MGRNSNRYRHRKGESPHGKPYKGDSRNAHSGGHSNGYSSGHSDSREGREERDWRAQRDADVSLRRDSRDKSEGEGEGAARNQPPFDLSRFVPSFKHFLNEHQSIAWEIAARKRITMFVGPAGTAKTHLAVAMALHELILVQSVKKVILCRPAIEAGEKLGYLPGDHKAKVDPYMLPVYDMLDEQIGEKGKLREQVNARIRVEPVGFLRGRTFKNCFIVLDEAQNCSWAQLKLVLTRLGTGSKLIVTGDADQSDLPTPGENPLARLMRNVQERGLDQGPFLGCYAFPESAIVRDDAVREVLKAF